MELWLKVVCPSPQVQIHAAAKKIYEQYLSPSSPHTVNVDDRATKAVESRLANPPPSIFSEAKEQVTCPSPSLLKSVPSAIPCLP